MFERRAEQEEIISPPGVPAPTTQCRSSHAGILMALKVLLALEVLRLVGLVRWLSSYVSLDIVKSFPEWLPFDIRHTETISSNHR